VTGNSVNLRAGPGTAFDSQGKVNKGERLALLGNENGWYKVLTSQGIAYLAGWLAKAIDAEPALAIEVPDSNAQTTDASGESMSGAVATISDEPLTDPAQQPSQEQTVTSGNDQEETVEPNSLIPTIILDAGHGGSDPGAIGPTGAKEKDANLSMVQIIAQMLQNDGYRVILTRSDDTFVSLDQRVAIANSASADLFVSIHCNASDSRGISGTSVYYYTGTEVGAELTAARKNLAEILHRELQNRVALTDRGIHVENFYVIKNTLMPSILVETAYISNPGEEVLINDPAFQNKVAQAVSTGVQEFLQRSSSSPVQVSATDVYPQQEAPVITEIPAQQ
jgi:N-acetylmuramoyl-L-alanine amidase